MIRHMRLRSDSYLLAALHFSSDVLMSRSPTRLSHVPLHRLLTRAPLLPKYLLNGVLSFSGLVRLGGIDLPSQQPPGSAADRKATRFVVRIHPSRRLKGAEGDTNVIPKKPLLLAIVAALSLLATSACTPTPATTTPNQSSSTPVTASPSVTLSPSVTPSSTPTPALDMDQAAALKAAESYEDALAKVRANPSKYDQYRMIDLLKPLAFDDMIQANLNGIRSWRNKGWHEEGSQVILRRDVDLPNVTSNGTSRVAVTICKDQRDLVVVDAKGTTVKAEDAQGPDFLQNTYDMRRGKAEGSFRVYEFGGDEVDGCSA